MPKPPFGFEKPKDSPGFLLWQTTIVWQRRIKKALKPFKVSHAQFVIMAILLWLESQNIQPTQVAIADRSKLDKMTISKSLRLLAAMGLVQREEHEIDTRAKKVTLTKKGKDLACKLIPIVEGIDIDFFGTVSRADQRSLINVLGTLTKNNDE